MPNRLITEAFPPTLVPPVLYLALIGLAPALQWYLLTMSSIPSITASAIPLLIGLTTPLIFTTRIWFFFGFGCALQLINTVRLLDIAFVDRKLSQNWSFREYAEYFFALENESTNRTAKEKQDKKSPVQFKVWPHNRDRSYYASLLFRISYQYAIYHVVCWYLDANPPNQNPPIRGFAELSVRGLVELLMLTLSVYYLLNILYMVVYHVVAELLQIPYRPMMNSPFISASFREFWSFRWNQIVKESLHRASFKPIIAYFTPKSTTPSNPPRAPMYAFILGAMSSFLLSGLVHEWMMLTICDTPSYGEHILFFIMHGMLTFAETFCSSLCKRYLGVNPWQKYPLLTAPITWSFMAMITPFFMNPLVRDDILRRARLPIFPCPFQFENALIS